MIKGFLKLFFKVLGVTAVIFFIGTIGANERDYIGFLQALFQSLISIGVVYISYKGYQITENF